MKTGFDNQKYLKLQSEKIRERIASFDNKLYLEFGGKLFDDYHASRVLPGFEPSSKLQMLLQLADQAEVIIAINAGDIEKNKVRADLGITYDEDVLRLMNEFSSRGLYVGSVCITRYSGQESADGSAILSRASLPARTPAAISTSRASPSEGGSASPASLRESSVSRRGRSAAGAT